MTEKLKDEKMGELIFNKFVESYIGHYILTQDPRIQGKTKQEILDFVTEEIHERLEDKNTKIDFVVDHTEDILERARTEKNNKQYDMAILFYATYFEHVLNRFIDLSSVSNDISNDCKNNIIRKTNIDDKCSWVLEILKLEPISDQERKTINKISQTRNAYIHYKWNADPYSDTPANQRKSDNESLIEDAEKVVTYLEEYEEQVIYNGQKKELF